jgi:hypothetical protein
MLFGWQVCDGTLVPYYAIQARLLIRSPSSSCDIQVCDGTLVPYYAIQARLLTRSLS